MLPVKSLKFTNAESHVYISTINIMEAKISNNKSNPVIEKSIHDFGFSSFFSFLI